MVLLLRRRTAALVLAVTVAAALSVAVAAATAASQSNGRDGGGVEPIRKRVVMLLHDDDGNDDGRSAPHAHDRNDFLVLNGDDDPLPAAGRRALELATGAFVPLEQSQTGWCTLWINASLPTTTTTTTTTTAGAAGGAVAAAAAVDDHDVMYAAGLLEAALSTTQIYHFYLNTVGAETLNGTIIPPRVAAYVENNSAWTRQMSAQYGATDPFWYEAGLLLSQWDGVMAGYYAHADPTWLPVTELELTALNFGGDMGGIMSAYIPSMRPAYNASERHNAYWDHCSGLVRIAPDYSDIFVAHDTWTQYSCMLRVYKHYRFTLKGSPAAAKTNADDGSGLVTRRVSFSSYPAMLSSQDDWYQTGSGLIVLETTNDVYNSSLNDIVAATDGKGVVLTWMRACIANALATSGVEWVALFGQPQRQSYLSGTYPNQWMVVDLKRFTPGNTMLQSGLLTVVEELPGFSVTQDVTQYLAHRTTRSSTSSSDSNGAQQTTKADDDDETAASAAAAAANDNDDDAVVVGVVVDGYWASYNVPFFPVVWEWMGYGTMYRTHGDDPKYSYTNCSRAQIFHRNATQISAFAEFTSLMTYNDWQHDPLSGGLSTHAIMSRGDLLVPALSAGTFGGVDSKVTNYAAGLSLSCLALSGPTHAQQPPFDWSQWWWMPHYGHPQVFDFEYVPQCPLLPGDNNDSCTTPM